jgi:NAD(P)-dependent dehydrogenase (short-subunit alcohol dehydrogenase family)
MPQAVIVGHDSQLGKIIGDYFIDEGWNVIGTTRRKSEVSPARFFLDSLDPGSISAAASEIMQSSRDWDVLILAIGALTPIGKFTEVSFSEWRTSFEVNFFSQIEFITEVLKLTSKSTCNPRRVITFAGSGTNSAPVSFSAYTLSKIALVKSMELLAAEYPEVFFLSLGTGWMKSPIHQQTLRAGKLAGKSLDETRRRLQSEDFGDPELLVDFMRWYLRIDDPRISGRNIALQGDDWKTLGFVDSLTSSDDAFKLRRLR